MIKYKSCPYCKKLFEPIRNNQITCGDEECKRIRSREIYKKHSDKKAKRRAEEEKAKASMKKVSSLADDNEIARSIGLDYGTYKGYLQIGYLEQYLRIKFQNESAANSDGRKIERSWIGGCNKSAKIDTAQVKCNPMERLTDYECMN